MTKKLRVLITALAIGLTPAALANAKTFPTKPVRVLLPFPTGTGPDVTMRFVGEKLGQRWGQQVIVDNRPGGNGWIAMDAARRASPDGYTLVLADTPLISLQQHLYSRMPYDPETDFTPIAPLYRTYFFVTVAANSRWKTIADLTAAAKAKPEEIMYGSSGNGGALHLGGAMLESISDAKMTHIPYKETPQIYMAVSNGDIDWAFGSASTTAPMLEAEKVRYLAIAAPQRHPAFPDVPTMAQAEGPADFELKTWVALFAPKGAPQAVIEQINADVAAVMQDPEVQARLTIVGFDALVQRPQELQNMVKADSRMYKNAVGKMKISLD